MKAILFQIWPIFAIVFVLLLLAAFSHLHSAKGSFFRLILVPLTVAGSFAAAGFSVFQLGYPVPLPAMPAEFVFLHYRVTVENGRKSGIELWLREKKVSRLLSVPYTKELEEQLEKALLATQLGGQAHMKRKKRGHGEDKGGEGEDILEMEVKRNPPKDENLNDGQAPDSENGPPVNRLPHAPPGTSV